METQIKLENISAIQKKFIVTIPADRVTKTVQTKFSEVQRTAKIKGFRPGKVPLNLVKQYYGEEVKSRALNQLIDQTYRDALKQHPLRIVGEPQIEGVPHKHEGGTEEHNHLHLSEGESLSYVATVEVVPEIEPKDYKGLALEKPAVQVTESDVEAVKKNLLDRKAEITPTDRASKVGDFVDIKYEGQLKTDQGFEAQANLSGDRYAELGSGQLIPEFESNLVGLKAGETKSFTMTYAKDYTDSQLAGKEAKYEVTVREVKEKKYPEFTDEYVKEFGYEDLKDFEAKARELLTKNKTEDANNQLRNNLIEKLIEKNEFEVPQALVMHQIRALADDYAQELKRYGFNDQMINNAVVSQLEDFKKRAGNQVRAGILLDAISKKEKIEPKEADFEAELKKTAENFGVEPQVLKDRFDSSPRDKTNFEFRVKEELTIQFLIQAAKVKETKVK